MHRDGLISIDEAGHDRRKKVINLTASGKDKWKVMKTFIGNIDKKAFNGITQEQQDFFHDI